MDINLSLAGANALHSSTNLSDREKVRQHVCKHFDRIYQRLIVLIENIKKIYW